MPIIDQNNLLSEEEKKGYLRVLKLYNHELEDFLLEVVEDQGALDMNDINYVILVKTKATHIEHQKSKAYCGSADSGTWLTEFEEDLKQGVF